MAALKLDDTALIQLPTGEIRSVKVTHKANVNLGKYGTFLASELIGKHPGFVYDIVDRTLVIQPPKRIEELVDTDATNELITDGNFVQPLTAVEIEALKKSGANASDIIKAQIEQHANYELKTEYSKDKYKKRKEAKFSKQITIIDPTMFNVCDYWFSKDPHRVRFMRPDALAQMVTLANVHPGRRFLVVDDTGGLVLTAVLDRLGGQGRAVAISDVLHATGYPCLLGMNFSEEQLQPLDTTLNWLHTKEDWEPIHDFVAEEASKIADESEASSSSRRKIVRENQRVAKRRDTYVSLQSTREELFQGQFDGLLIASEYEPTSIVRRLSPYLAGSANVVVHSPHLQVLAEMHTTLRALTTQYLAPNITECWTRRYQVLPGRTHPEMQTSGSGGFLLHVTKIFGDITVSSTIATERKIHRQRLAESKRKKKEAEAAAAGGSNTATGTGIEAEGPQDIDEDQFSDMGDDLIVESTKNGGDVSMADGDES